MFDIEDSILGQAFVNRIKKYLTGNPFETRIMIGFDKIKHRHVFK